MFLQVVRRVTHMSRRNMSLALAHGVDSEFKEVEIPVPWGKLAGKHWGPTNNEPILALHGWQDNASSFDNLVQYLPENTSLLALDLPGHGESSWLPKGQMYSLLHMAQSIHRVKEYYNMDKIGLIGHSIGAGAAFYYASLFSNNVKFIVTLDFCKLPSIKLHHSIFAHDWNRFFSYEKLSSPMPTYTEKDIVKKNMEALGNLLDESSCKVMLERSVTRNENGSLSFSRDPRMKLMSPDLGLMLNHFRDLAKRICCPFVIVRGDKSDDDNFLLGFTDVFKLFEEHSNLDSIFTVSGNHYFHINNAPDTCKFINPFILRHT